MNKAQYAEYLQSEHWKGLRRQKLEESGYKCQHCWSRYNLNVHHRTYRPNLLDTTLADLEALCRYCHKKEHGLTTDNDRPIYTRTQREEIVNFYDGRSKPLKTNSRTRRKARAAIFKMRKAEKRLRKHKTPYNQKAVERMRDAAINAMRRSSYFPTESY